MRAPRLAVPAPAPLALALALALGLVPGALAQGEPFDPLALTWTAFPTVDGRLQATPAAPGGVHFPPSDPATPALPLAFSAPTPVPFRAEGDARVTLLVEAQMPVLTQGSGGESLEVALFSDAKLLGVARHKLAAPLMAPGAKETVDVTLALEDVIVPRGATLSLQVKAMMPAVPAEGLRLVVDASALVLPMRVASVADLDLQDAPLVSLAASEAYAPPAGTVAFEVRIGHDGAIAETGWSEAQGRAVVLVLRGEEDDEMARAAHASADRDARRAAAHAYTLGSLVVRVHPGVGVVVPVGAGPAEATLACLANCPPGDSARVSFARASEGPGVVTDDPSVLIPPPRATTGIPVSDDAPAEGKGVPGPGAGALAALVVAAIVLSRRR